VSLLNSVVNGLQKVSKNIDDNKELRDKKTRVLKRFTLRQLQYIAKNYNIKVKPTSFSGIMDNKTPELNDYITCLRSDLSYEQILDYAKKKNLDLSDINQEEKEKKLVAIKDAFSTPKADVSPGTEQEGDVLSLYTHIKQKIQSFKLDFAVNSEDEFEKHMFQFLKYQFPTFEINRQVPCGDGQDKVDIVVNVPDPGFEIAIELKLGTSRNHLRNARAQVEDYSKFFDFTLLAVLDIGKVEMDVYQDISTKIQALGVDFVLLEGQLTERKSLEVKKKEKIIKELIK
jgi:hypothetical protein